MWVLLAALVVAVLIKAFFRDFFLASMVTLVVMISAGMVAVTTAADEVQVLAWAAILPGVVLGWCLRPLNVVAGPSRGKNADGDIYYYTVSDRNVLRRAQLRGSWLPLVVAGVMMVILWGIQNGSGQSSLPALVGAFGVGFALAGFVAILSRRVVGFLEIRRT